MHHSIMYKFLHLLYSSQALTCILQYSHASHFILQLHFKQLVLTLVQVSAMDTRTAEWYAPSWDCHEPNSDHNITDHSSCSSLQNALLSLTMYAYMYYVCTDVCMDVCIRWPTWITQLLTFILVVFWGYMLYEYMT